MTAVGKILVFFNLIFSLIVGAFVVTVYISQSHWAHDYTELARKYEVDEASIAAYQKQLKDSADYSKNFTDTVLKDAKLEKLAGFQPGDDAPTKLKKITDMMEASQKAYDAQKAEADKMRDDLSTAKKDLDASNVQLTGALANVEKREAQTEVLKKELKDEIDKNQQLVKDIGKEHDQMVAFKIRADSAELRRNELEKENDRLARDNQKMLANGGNAVASGHRDGPNPPLDSVEGLVSEVSPGGLVRITIGSDAGLQKGNTLEAYRLNTQVPDQSKYLGRIKIIEVTATEAVGQLLNRSSAPLQPGDTVSSRILGG